MNLEYLRENIDDRALVEHYFSAGEAAVLARLPFSARQKAFLMCWTCKEAYIKAGGEGLSIDLRSSDALDSGDSESRLHLRSNRGEAAPWALMDLEAPAGYVSALAMEGHEHRASCRLWPSDIATPASTPLRE
jgi:4'-phosphopantetheinyl transferase